MNEKDLRKLVASGDAAILTVELSLQVKVWIKDVRRSFGRVDALVMPVAGYGAKWVSSDRIGYVVAKRVRP